MFHSHEAQKLGRYVMEKTLISLLIRWLLEFLYKGLKVKVLSDSLQPYGIAKTLCSPWHSPGQNPGVGSLSLFQGIFPAQGLNLGLLHCKWILYQLSHMGSP